MDSTKLLKVLALVSVLALSGAGLFAEVTIVEGEIGPGSLYRFYVPDNWNGDVVYFAHGMVDPTAPVTLDFGYLPGFTGPLLERGFAFALSSFSENGYAIKRGAQETHQLRGLFKSYFGKPRRSYLMGISMGGGVVVPLIEDYPNQYDGAFIMCGINGGTVHAMKHFFDFRVLFDYFYPGVLPGEITSLPEGTTFFADLLPLAFQALSSPTQALELFAVDQLELEIVDPVSELAPAMIGNLASYTFWALDFPGRVHGHDFYDNLDTIYTGSSDDVALNAGVERLGPASRPAENYMKHYFQPTGKLAIPLITLHGQRDPIVPLSHEAIYADRVADWGASDLLLQRTSETFGHCAFTEAEWLGAFMDLVTWVETGVKPAP